MKRIWLTISVLIGALLVLAPAGAGATCDETCKKLHAKRTKRIEKWHEKCVERADKWKEWVEKRAEKAKDPAKAREKIQARYDRKKAACDKRKETVTAGFEKQLEQCEKYCEHKAKAAPPKKG